MVLAYAHVSQSTRIVRTSLLAQKAVIDTQFSLFVLPNSHGLDRQGQGSNDPWARCSRGEQQQRQCARCRYNGKGSAKDPTKGAATGKCQQRQRRCAHYRYNGKGAAKDPTKGAAAGKCQHASASFSSSILSERGDVVGPSSTASSPTVDAPPRRHAEHQRPSSKGWEGCYGDVQEVRR